MDANILCALLAQRIPSEQFQLHGLGIHWMDETYNTPENETIAADVIANYGTLEATYLAVEVAEKEARETAQLAKAQEIIDNLPDWQQVSNAIDSATTIAALKVITKKLARVFYIHLRE